MKKYALQMKSYPWETHWETRFEFDTLEEAKSCLAQRPFPEQYRIAEAYTVTRYKAVKL